MVKGEMKPYRYHLDNAIGYTSGTVNYSLYKENTNYFSTIIIKQEVLHLIAQRFVNSRKPALLIKLQFRMSSTSIQVAHLRSIGMYEPSQQFGKWKDVPQSSSSLAVPSSIIKDETSPNHKSESTSEQQAGQSDNDHESSRVALKTKRRLAQNREAARKSRLRKKVYVQQLESSRLKLAQLEQQLEQVKLQNLCAGSALRTYIRPDINAGIAAFDKEYSEWLEEQYRRICMLRNAVKAGLCDAQLQTLVQGSLNHYHNLFQMKAQVAKLDVFYLMSGAWRASVERFFLWIGGFRPSDLLKVVMPYLEPLTEQQEEDIKKLSHSSQQAEDVLSQGLERLQQSLGQILSADVTYDPLMTTAREKLAAIDNFVNQADHLRESTLNLMSKILTTHQAARGLIALGDYFHRLSTISSLWAARPRELGQDPNWP
ncbi:uncharacterized protein [Phyllobates terribilis]|uniref:uncharacterized protein n=1 Tax=Phyllobates terribilis TaxID=111132 RepID=UPI003CCB6705